MAGKGIGSMVAIQWVAPGWVAKVVGVSRPTNEDWGGCSYATIGTGFDARMGH